MNLYWRHIVFILIVCFHIDQPIVKGQKYRFKRLSIEQGLSNNYIRCIVQDNKGFMWFGTSSGLNKYDGYSITTYKNSLEDTTSLSNDIVTSFFEDTKGNLWIGTQGGGLNLYNRDKDCFVQYNHNENKKNSLSHYYVTFIYEDSEQNLWVGTEGGGLNLFNKENGSFQTYEYAENGRNSLSDNSVICIHEDKKGNLWIGTGKGITIYQREKGVFLKLEQLLANNGLGKYFINCIVEDENNNIWVGTRENGLYKLKYKSEKDISLVLIKLDKESYINSNIIRDLIVDKNRLWVGTGGGLYVYDIKNERVENDIQGLNKNGSLSSYNISQLLVDNYKIWIGSWDSGISVYDAKGNSLSHFNYDVLDDKSVSNDMITSLYKDKIGNVWIGTFAGGVNLADRYSIFSHYFKRIDNNNSINHNSVLSFLEDRNGDLWIGTDGGGLSHIKKDFDGTIQYKHYLYENNPKSLTSNVVLSIIEDKDDVLWIGTWDGLTKMNRKHVDSFEFTRYRHDKENSNSLVDNRVWDIFEDSKGRLWIGTCGGGLNLFNKATNSFKAFKFNKNDTASIGENYIWDILEDSDSNIWIATSNGLSKMVDDNEGEVSFINFRYDNEKKNSLKSNFVFAIHEDTKNELWVGTLGGIHKFNKESESFECYQKKDGLSDDAVLTILEDEQRNLWLSTYKGLTKFNPEQKTFQIFDIKDGLQSNQFNIGACLKSKTGQLYFGGINGYNVFYPDSVKKNINIPPIVLTGFQVFNKPVTQYGESSPLNKHISEAKEVMLSYKQTVFSFEFSSLNYIIPEKNSYAYKMEGFDENWLYTNSNKRFATYTNLDPGEYIFKVKASNNDGVWNETGTAIKVIIAPPFWLTLWFKFLIGAFVIASLYAYYRLRIRYLKIQKKVLQKKVHIKTKELIEVNEVLASRNEEMNQQKEEILSQNEELIVQRDRIEAQNEELHKLNTTKDKFFSIIAHDLKNPFNSILGIVELIDEDYDKMEDVQKKELIKHVRQASNNSYTLLENLLYWSRSQLNKINYEPVSIDLFEMVNSILELLRIHAEEKNINLISEVEKSVFIYADKDMINTVLRNLVSNAVKFTKPKGSVIVNADSKDGTVTIRVEDTGVGMSGENVDKLFNLEELHSTKGTKGEKGTGLGLILCKEFLDKSGSKIEVESVIGKGSVFKFELPVATKP